MTQTNYLIREAKPSEFSVISDLLVEAYSSLKGFQTPEQQPEYYNMLQNIGDVTKLPKAKLLIAEESTTKNIDGVVIYFGDMQYYGSESIASKEKNAAGFRLLAVSPKARGLGLGKLLSQTCIALAKIEKHKQLIIHSTHAMKIAWKMYENMGFKRSKDLDFAKNNFPVFGFRLIL